jgi:hypothetical protein
MKFCVHSIMIIGRKRDRVGGSHWGAASYIVHLLRRLYFITASPCCMPSDECRTDE